VLSVSNLPWWIQHLRITVYTFTNKIKWRTEITNMFLKVGVEIELNLKLKISNPAKLRVWTVCLRLRSKPRPFCAWVQHANHSATEPPKQVYHGIFNHINRISVANVQVQDRSQNYRIFNVRTIVYPLQYLSQYNSLLFWPTLYVRNCWCMQAQKLRRVSTTRVSWSSVHATPLYDTIRYEMLL